MKKFEVGKVYTRPGLYIPSWLVEVVARADHGIIARELEHPETEIFYHVEIDNEGNEVVKVWEYCGECGYMRA